MSSRLSSHPTLTPNLTTTLQPNCTPVPSINLARSLQHIPYESLTTISPLDLFLEQFHTDNSETRVDAMRRCVVVANAIGRDATINKLLPFLANHVLQMGELDGEKGHAAAVPTGSEEDDEILLILAEQLGHMVLSGLVPGYRALIVLPILEQLASVEETVVRDKAVESINGIIPLVLVDGLTVRGKEEEEARQTCVKTAPGLLLAMVKRMAHSDWFTAKISSCAILPCIYQYFNRLKPNAVVNAIGEEGGRSVEETRSELRNIYKELSEDEAPMVRRSAGKHLGRYVEAVATLPYAKKGPTGGPAAKEFVIPGGSHESMIKKTVTKELKYRVMEEVVPVYQWLANDEQDSVRLLAVSSSGSVGCALGLDGDMCNKVVMPIIRAGSLDLSWRVRHHLAKDFAVVAQSQGFHDSSHSDSLNEVFISYTALLQDFEAEVRASAVENIARMAQLGGADLFQTHIAPILPSLADDMVMEVRGKLAEKIMDCCDASICTALPDRVILQDIKPLIEGFLNDEYPEVKLQILTKLSRVTHLLDKMDVVVESILNMTKAQNWRVRESVSFLLPNLAEARGVTFFEEYLLDPWMTLLLDQVAEVRLACVAGMPKLLTITGAVWIQREIIPHYIKIYEESPSYLSRMTVLRSFSKLALAETGLTSSVLESVVNQLLRGLEDNVANVRIVAAKGLAEISNVVDDAIMSVKIRPALEARVASDEDEDCKYFAENALETCGQ